MKGIGKNIRFYCETLFQNFIKTIVLVVVMTFVMVFMEGGDYKEAASQIVPLYLMVFVVILNFTSAMSLVTVTMPLTVSLGSTRKGGFWGLIISELLLNVGLLLLVYICYYFLFNDLFNSLWAPFALSVVGFFLIMVSMGNLVGVISLKYGKTKGAILYVIGILVVMFGIICFIMSGVFDWITDNAIFAGIFKGPWILLLGIAIDVVIGWFSYNVIRKSDLQIG